jgi:ATP-binding cassette subfamily B protein/subfamily B ATP-binding cassette protein MsbA
MSLSFFDKNPIGRLVTRVTNDTETLHEMYSGVLVNLFNDIFLLIGIVVVMIHLDAKLALLSFIVIPIIIVSTLIFRIKARKVYRIIRLKIAKLNSSLNENLTGMKTIHVFKRERQQFEKFDSIT